MNSDIEEILFSAEQIKARVQEMGLEISRDYADKDLLLVTVLRGAIIFLADLSRSLNIQASIDFMVVTRYGYRDQPEEVKILKDLDAPIEGRHVLIVEDIIDNGETLHYITKTLKLRNPVSLKICTLFDKPYRRTVPIKPDYNGFVCPDRFVVGYGLDFKQRYRNFPFLAVLKREVCPI